MNVPHFEKCFVCNSNIVYNEFGSFFCNTNEQANCFWGRDVDRPLVDSFHFISVRWQDNKEDEERVICFDYQENKISVYLDDVYHNNKELVLPFIEASPENYQFLKIQIPKLLLL